MTEINIKLSVTLINSDSTALCYPCHGIIESVVFDSSLSPISAVFRISAELSGRSNTVQLGNFSTFELIDWKAVAENNSRELRPDSSVKYYVSLGKKYKILDDFPNDDNGSLEANNYMLSNPNSSVLVVAYDRIFLSSVHDLGTHLSADDKILIGGGVRFDKLPEVALMPIKGQSLKPESNTSQQQPGSSDFSIKLDDGKYELILKGNRMSALRHGEPWRDQDLIGDNLVLAMAHRILELEDLNQKLKTKGDHQ